LKQILRDIFNILGPHEAHTLWKLALADVLISILDIAFLIGLLYVINFYTQTGVAPSTKYFSLAIFNDHPILPIAVFLLLFAIKNMFGFFISKAQYNFVYGVASRISCDNLLQYLNGPFSDYVHVDSSIMNRKINQQPIEFCHYVLNGIQQIFSQLVLILITVLAIIIFNPFLLPLLILILAPPVFLISFFMKRKLQGGRLQGKTMSEKSIQHLQEALTGYVESNVYLKNDFFTNRYHRFQAELNRYLSERLIMQNMPTRFIEVFAVFGLFALIVLNFLSSHTHSIQFITLGALMAAAYKIIPGIVKITNTAGQVKTYAYTTKGLISGIELQVNQSDLRSSISSISCENVYFNFGEKSVLKAFSLNLIKGDMVGILGLSGKGKTTLVNLLLGFLSPDAGSIYYNGEMADAETRRRYWSGISYVKQQHFFMHASVVENITFKEGDYDREKLKNILTVAGIDKMIKSFPEGLNTMITENGKNFSGGQRQRFILARALYKDFDLLILDEPFNELDEAAEIELLRQLQLIAAAGKIILLITHNIAAFSFCNKKIQLDEQG
jgi:ABC-type bacteriocin/lantibiotic exporter with double-glycine peptidase domain